MEEKIKMENKITIKNTCKHFTLITKHKWEVFKLAWKIGIPWRGLLHDLSKYSPTEFWESVRYYNGTHSPITEAKKDKGYSEAWLHHKGRNKHHIEYWLDEAAPNLTPLPPFPYVAEMLCDKVAAGIVYEGDKWTKEYELFYYTNERSKIKINKNLDLLILDFLTKLSVEGIDKTFRKDYVSNLYCQYQEKEKIKHKTHEIGGEEWKKPQIQNEHFAS